MNSKPSEIQDDQDRQAAEWYACEEWTDGDGGNTPADIATIAFLAGIAHERKRSEERERRAFNAARETRIEQLGRGLNNPSVLTFPTFADYKAAEGK